MFGFLTRKLLGFVSGGLAIALLSASIFGWVQTGRLASANETIKSLKTTATLYVQRITDDSSKLATRDRLIDAQNKAVLAMQAVNQADRKAYEGRIAAAEKLASTQTARAKDIMSRQATTQDELQRSREALRLIQEVVAADQAPVAPQAPVASKDPNVLP